MTSAMPLARLLTPLGTLTHLFPNPQFLPFQPDSPDLHPLQQTTTLVVSAAQCRHIGETDSCNCSYGTHTFLPIKFKLYPSIRRVLRTMNGNEQRRPANLQEEVPNPMGLGLQTLIQSMLRIVDEEVGENARTDVDRMSYEQLLDVGRIGSRVSVGLTEEAISERLKQRTISPDDEVHLEGELCSVCLEKFAAGEDVGALICNHMFHIRCIKLWLRLKNLCPMCKRPALVEP